MGVLNVERRAIRQQNILLHCSFYKEMLLMGCRCCGSDGEEGSFGGSFMAGSSRAWERRKENGKFRVSSITPDSPLQLWGSGDCLEGGYFFAPSPFLRSYLPVAASLLCFDGAFDKNQSFCLFCLAGISIIQ